MNSLEMLGFSSSSVIPPESEVNTAYRKAAKMWHPDRFVDAREKEMATERFKLISQARDDLLAHKILEYNVRTEAPGAKSESQPFLPGETKRDIFIIIGQTIIFLWHIFFPSPVVWSYRPADGDVADRLYGPLSFGYASSHPSGVNPILLGVLFVLDILLKMFRAFFSFEVIEKWHKSQHPIFRSHGLLASYLGGGLGVLIVLTAPPDSGIWMFISAFIGLALLLRLILSTLYLLHSGYLKVLWGFWIGLAAIFIFFMVLELLIAHRMVDWPSILIFAGEYWLGRLLLLADEV